MNRVRRPICPLPPASDPLRALVWGNPSQRSTAGAGLAAAKSPTMLMPETSTLANRKVVMPPSTASGMEAMAAPNFLASSKF